MARKPKSSIDIVLDHDRQLAALRAAELRRMHQHASRMALDMASVFATGAGRNAFSGILPVLMAQPRQRRRRR